MLSRYAVAVVMLCIFFSSVAHATANLGSWNTTVSMDMDKDAVFEVLFEYNEFISEHEYFVRSGVSDVRVYADNQRINCDVQAKSTGTTIKCDNFNAKSLRYVFVAKSVIKDMGDLRQFEYRFSVSRIADSFGVTIKLPVGFTIVPEERLAGTGLYPVEPDNGMRGSDGRRIFVTWILQKPQLGDKIEASVVYERTGFDIDQIILLILVLFLIVVMVIIAFAIKKRSVHDVLPMLHNNERKIIEILMRDRKEIDQRRIVKETGLSKSMISRIVKDLQSRGIVDVKRLGRTNKLSLIEKQKEPEQKTEKKEDKNGQPKEEKLPYTPEKQQKDDDSEKL